MKELSPMKVYLFACWSKVSPFRREQNKFDRIVSLESVFIRLLEQILPFQKGAKQVWRNCTKDR